MEHRLLGADFIRAAACLTVLFHHLAQRMSWNDDLGAIEPFRVFTQIGTFGVAMFFVLSGFLLARPFWKALDNGDRMPSLRVYALRRAARILPGFWLALCVTFILSSTVFDAELDGWLVLRFLAGLFLLSDWHWVTLFPVEVNGPLWSIGFEITSYVLLPLGLAALFLLRPAAGRGWQARVLWLGVVGLALVAHWLFVEFVPVDGRMRGWIDVLALAGTGIALLLVLVGAPVVPTVTACLAAAALQAARLAGWNPWAARRQALLWILHVSYAWVPIGLVLLACGVAGKLPMSAGVHALTLGAIGGLIIGMITRTALGHTARPLKAGRIEVAAYLLVQSAVLVRLAPILFPGLPYLPWTTVAASAWSLAFALYFAKYAPMLFAPRLDGRDG